MGLKRYISKMGSFLLMITSGFLVMVILSNCNQKKQTPQKITTSINDTLIIEAESYIHTNTSIKKITKPDSILLLHVQSKGWMEYQINVQIAGRYSVAFFSDQQDTIKKYCWVEDYAGNAEGRTYNITGNVLLSKAISGVDGSPLDTGMHIIRVHADSGVLLDKIQFTLLREHTPTPQLLTQHMEGENWELVWSDEFNGTGLPDSTKWLFDIGNWGWGNNELQYYTVARTENARQENGNLIIEARKNDLGYPWTSTRLTTRGKVSFKYGKIEFRAMVPIGLGTWSAGWLLGDAYVDEKSWPVCGEIDVLEMVGFEHDASTGNGLAHASIHCGAYYFKLNNQPTAITEVLDMGGAFHNYTLEWYPDSILIYLDGKKYFTYNDTKSELTWPYSNPQNIIVNLAIGGGWGGAKGIDSTLTSQSLILDYVRVYARR